MDEAIRKMSAQLNLMLENWVLFGFFWGFVTLLALLELKRPALPQKSGGDGRLVVNVIFGALGMVIGPVIGLTSASVAQSHHFGLLNLINAPLWSGLLVSVLALSFADYWLHRVFHRVDWLWRLHKVHHSDDVIDISTAWRAHPLNNVLIGAAQAVPALLLGLPILAVLLYQLLHAFVVTWQHANIAHNPIFNRWAAYLLVTPEFHQVHHSAARAETDSNYSVLFSIWDWILGTAKRLGPEEHQAIRIGLGSHYDQDAGNLRAQVMLPFRRAQ